MKTNKKNIDEMVSKILSEEIEKKSKEMTEKLSKKQSKYLDVAKPKGKLTLADFKTLGTGKHSEVKETGHYDTNSEWYGNDFFSGNDDTEETSDFENLEPKEKESFLGKLKNKIFGKKEETDEEVEEGNAFTDALRKTKKGEKFKLGGKEYTDTSNLDESLKLTENEMIDLIESIVLKEKEKENIAKKYISGLAKTVKAQEQSKKENKDNIEMVTKKLKEYLKNSSTDSDFDMNPKDFPKGNGQDKKNDTKAYQKSDAVEEYIEAFAFPGQTNLVYDEIQPEDEKVEMYLKGDRKTGNAELDEDGNALGNVVPSKTGERFMKNYKDNLYGAEQMGSSYKRYPQPVDIAGEKKGNGSLKSRASKAQKVIDKVEESESKKEKVINEEMNKMKKLINYNKNTQ